jgi:hypothetical protein
METNYKDESANDTKKCVDKSITTEYYNADMYVKMAHVVTNRTYWAFSIMIIVSIMTIVVLFNHYLSYEEHFIKKMNVLLRVSDSTNNNATKNKIDTIVFGRMGQSELLEALKLKDTINSILPIDSLKLMLPEKQNPFSKEIREQYIRNHIDASYISIPIIGIKISINDILILMGLAFLILAGWLYLCIRSENFTIGKALSLSKNKSIDIRRYIFYGICFNNMFFPTTQRKQAYSELSNITKSLIEELEDFRVKTKKKYKKWWLIKWGIRLWRGKLNLAFFIPLIIMIVNLYIHQQDIRSLVDESKTYTTIKYDNNTYYINDSKIARFDFKDENIHNEKDPYKTYLWWIFSIALGLTVFTCYYCWKTYKYQLGTTNILYHFKQRFKHEDDCEKNIDYHKLQNKPADVQIVTIDTKIIFSGATCIKALKYHFAKKYDTQNGYYLLTHSGDKNEIDRLIEYLENSGYKYEKDSTENTGTHHLGDEKDDIEYFILLNTKQQIQNEKSNH